MRSQQNHVITAETVKPAVDYLFRELSPEQWIRLATGSPDQSLSCSLAEVLGDTVELFLASVLDRIQHEELTTEAVEAVVGNIVPRALAQALEIEGEVSSQSGGCLNWLIVKHVMERVKWKLCSDSEDPAENYTQKMTDMYTTTLLVQEATVVIQELLSSADKPQAESKKIAIVNPQPTDKDGVRSVRPDSSRRTERLTDGENQTKNQDQTAAPPTRQTSKITGLTRQIKRFIRKYYRKHSAKVAPANFPETPKTSGTKEEPSQNTQVEGQERSACTSPGEPLPPVNKDSDVTSEEEHSSVDDDANVTYVETFIPEEDVLEVTSVSEFVAEEQPAEVLQEQKLQSEPRFHQSSPVEDSIPEDEASQVTSASVEKGAESGEESADLRPPGVCPAVVETAAPQAPAASDFLTFNETQQLVADDEGQKASVSMLVHGLIVQATKTSDSPCSPENLRAAHGRLLENIWAQVQGKEIHVDPERTLKHSKKIYSLICKATRCPGELVGVLLLLEDKTFDKAVVSSFLKHLTRSGDKPAFLLRFFSAMREAFRQKGTGCENPAVGAGQSKTSEAVDNGSRNYAADDEASSDTEKDSASVKSEDTNCGPDRAGATSAGSGVSKRSEFGGNGSRDYDAEDEASSDSEDSASVITAATADGKQDENHQETAAEGKERQAAVKTLISDLMGWMIDKSDQSYTKEQCDAICDRLFQKLWVEVKDSLDSLSPEKIENEAIFEDICKKWRKPKSLLKHLNLGRSQADKTVLSSIKKHLLNPPETLSWIKGLFNNLQESVQCCPTGLRMVL